MRFSLFDYQAKAIYKIYRAWASGLKVVFLTLPTGTGKTVVFSRILAEHEGVAIAMAHRNELVSQISLALAREGITHNIIGQKSIVRECTKIHVTELGTSYIDPNSPRMVASVKTLLSWAKAGKLKNWVNLVTLWVMDEAHHILRDNEWGKAVALFPNAKGLGVTATPGRTNGEGLGSHADGVADDLIIGFTAREAVRQGYLTDYIVHAPQSDIDLSKVPISAVTGDYSGPKLIKAVKQSRVIGDIVDHYLKIASGKLGVSFLPDVETAELTAGKFERAGVRAAVIHAKTPTLERSSLIRAFKRREIFQLVNVDLFGEGFDLPAIQCVSFGRPSESYNLFAQQLGRVLRVMVTPEIMSRWHLLSPAERLQFISASDKPYGIVLDHVGNFLKMALKYGIPDVRTNWTLDRVNRKENGKAITQLKTCLNPECLRVYERFRPVCPYCGHKPQPLARSGPEFVDGDLTELDAGLLAKLRGEIETLDRDPEEYRSELMSKRVPYIGQLAHVKRFKENQDIRGELRDTIALWAGYQRYFGHSDAESYRKFYLDFGADVLTAQLKSRAEMESITGSIKEAISHLGASRDD